VPTDDIKTATFWVRLHPNSDGKPEPSNVKIVGRRKREPGVYRHVEDGWWGVESHEQDRMAQESQGIICDRSREHLGLSDRGVITLREMIIESIEAVQQGKDPIGVLRVPEQNVLIDFDASMEEIGVLR
jgi:5,5'-dehydrodivanillate O-demethylase